MHNNLANEKNVGMGLIAFEKDGLWAVKKEDTGEILCEPEFDSIEHFSNGYAVFTRGKRKGFINAQGKKVFEKYYDVRSFVNGFAAVRLFFERWTFIDEMGMELTKKTYQEVGDFNLAGYAVVREDEGTCNVIDKYGVEVVTGILSPRDPIEVDF